MFIEFRNTSIMHFLKCIQYTIWYSIPSCQHIRICVPRQLKLLEIFQKQIRFDEQILLLIFIIIKKFLYENLKDAPGGTHIVMEGVHSDTEQKIIAIGYKYSMKKVLFYVATPNAGST